MRQLEVRRRFESRLLVFQGAAVLILLILFGHLAHLQWIEHRKLALQADQNRINILPVLPLRGEILDREGRGLAVNQVAWQVLMIPERVTDIRATLDRLAAMLDWSEHKRAVIGQRIRRSRPDRPVLLDDKLRWRTVAPIAARLHRLDGIDVHAGPFRYYPEGALTSHLIGYLSLARKADLERGRLATEFVGRSGAERAFDDLLRGRPGIQREEVDARGRRVAVLDRTPPQQGATLRLALDLDLQRAAARALGARTGAVAVIDIHTGEILTLLSQPGYDTNRFITGLESDQWQAWLSDPRKPLLNRVIQAVYPPGSTFKPITAFAALRASLPLATGRTTCPGYLELADRRLRCWKRKGHGTIDLHRALVESCDVYFYELGDQLGMAAISEEAARWGLGQPTGISLAEARGVIPATQPRLTRLLHDTKAQRMKWFRGETMITAIGQGAVAVTPLQMARMAGAIANGGLILKPRLRAGQPPEVLRRVDIPAEALTVVRRAMREVVSDPHGTAYHALADAPWAVAGKTGTAQVVAMAQDEEAARTDTDTPRDHAWFIGYAPYRQPRIAFAVLVEHGGHGGSAAAPVAAAIVRAAAGKEDR
ncbi:MAG: penicillin-binding protein 2 [Mariprofundaceae bacterium]